MDFGENGEARQAGRTHIWGDRLQYRVSASNPCMWSGMSISRIKPRHWCCQTGKWEKCKCYTPTSANSQLNLLRTPLRLYLKCWWWYYQLWNSGVWDLWWKFAIWTEIDRPYSISKHLFGLTSWMSWWMGPKHHWCLVLIWVIVQLCTFLVQSSTDSMVYIFHVTDLVDLVNFAFLLSHHSNSGGGRRPASQIDIRATGQ